jgi:hypothetical protein
LEGVKFPRGASHAIWNGLGFPEAISKSFRKGLAFEKVLQNGLDYSKNEFFTSARAGIVGMKQLN